MGKTHAAARSNISKAQAEEEVREAEFRRGSAERERQLLTSYLGTADQVAGRGQFAVNPETLRYAQRYQVDAESVRDIEAAQRSVGDPLFAGQDPSRGAQGVADRANDLLAQAEAAARSGDIRSADRLYSQAQSLIGGQASVLQGAFNLTPSEDSAAQLRAGSAEGQIVGRQLLAARELADPNSERFEELRGRLLDPSLAAISAGEEAAQVAIDENVRNAERAIASERSQIEGEIRQLSARGGVGFNPRATLAARSETASNAAFARAQTYSDAAVAKAQTFATAAGQRAMATVNVNQYLNEFSKRMAEDSVRLAQEWVSGTAGVRDEYQLALDRLDLFSAEMANDWAKIYYADYQGERDKADARKQLIREKLFDFGLGAAGGLLGPTIGALGAKAATKLGAPA